MANVNIKKLPDPVYRQLKKYARIEGRSLNAQIIHILQADLDNQARFQKMRDSRKELERLVASMPRMADSAPLIRKDRNRDT